MTKGKKWLALGSALVGLVASVSMGVMFEETQRVSAKAEYNVVAQQDITYSYDEVVAEDIADMLISNGIVGATGSESAFYFATGDTVRAEDNIIHTAGSDYWDWDMNKKELNVNFKMQFANWGNGWIGFRMSDDMTELRIYNDKIEVSGNGEVKGTKAFESSITSDLHLVNMTYQFRKADGVVNGSRLTVTIDGVAYVVESDWYSTGGGNAFRLWNATGTGVYIETAKVKEVTYNEVVAEDIADMLISNGVLGATGVESAFAFATGDTVKAEDNIIHTPGSGYWDWDMNKKELNVNFKMQFANWGNGWIGFRMSDGMTELRIYNDKIEVSGNGEVTGTKAFESSITSGLHLVNMTYQFRKADGVVNGSRLTVTIDGVAYVVESDWYSTGGGNAFRLWNATGTGVYIETAKVKEVTYNEVVAEDIADMLISNGVLGGAGAETAFAFANGDTVNAEDNRIHTPGSDYWQWETEKKELNVNFKMQFANWGNGWIGFKMSDGMTELRIYNNKIELSGSGGVKGEQAFASALDGLHLVNITYQFRKADGVVNGSRLTVTIDGVAYVVESDWYSTGGGNAFVLWNATGTGVYIETAKVKEVTYNEVVAEDIADMLISNGVLGGAGAETAFAFATGDTVKTAENRIHTPGSDYWDWDMNKKDLNVNFQMQFANWNGGWIGFKMSDGMTELRIYNDKIEVSGYGGVKGTQAFATTMTDGLHLVNITYQFRKADGVENGSRLTVTIDGVAYVVESDWYSTGGGNAFVLWNGTGAEVYVLSAQKRLVTLDVNGGTGVGSVVVNVGAGANEIPTPSKEGYTFAGWTLSDGTAIPQDATVTDNITIKATWVITNYTAKVVRANGTEEIISFTINDRAEKLAAITLTADNEEYTYAWATALPSELALNNEQVFTEVATEVVKPHGVRYISISTAGDIGLNFYVYLGDAVEAVATITMKGESQTVAGAYQDDLKCWKFTYPVAPKDYQEIVTLVVDDVTAEYSVAAYANALPEENPAYELVVNLMNYCEAARVYFAGEEATATEDLNADLSQYKATISGEDEDVTISGATLILETKTTINVYFKAENVANVICTVNGVQVEAVLVNEGTKQYVISIDGIVAKDLDEVYTITIGDYTITYCALSYVEGTLSRNNGNVALTNLVKALYDVSVEAEKYFK